MASPSVEVKCLDTFAYYPAFLKDYNHADQVLVGYPNAWKADEWVLLDNVRNAAPPTDMASFQPVAGDVVEAQAKSSDDEPYSWWKATVKTVRGEFYMISYSSWEDEFNEILEKDMLRPANKNPALRPTDIKKLELPLPKDLRDSGSLDVRQLNSVLETSGALSVHVDNKKQTLVILGNSVSVKRAQLLANMAFKHLGEIARLKERTAKHQDHLSALKQRLNEGHLEVFPIHPPDLIGLVIGQAGKNIKKVEKMPGVLNVSVDSGASANPKVSILAKSEAEAKAARAQLEFVETRYPILKRQAGRVVGKAFANMIQIEKDSGVVRIKLDDRKGAAAAAASAGPEEKVDLIVIGTADTVADALLLLNHHMEFLDTVSQLTEDERSLNQEVRKLNQEAGVYENEQQRYGRGGYAGRGARGPRPQGQRQYNGANPADFPALTDRRRGQQQGGQQQQQQQQQQQHQASAAAAEPEQGGGRGGRGGQGGGRGGRGGGRGGAAAGSESARGQQQQQPQQQQQQQGKSQQQQQQQQQQGKQQQGQQQGQQQPQAAAAGSSAAPAAAPADGAQSARRGRGRGGQKDGAGGAAPAAAAPASGSAPAAAAAPAQAGAAAEAPKQQQQQQQPKKQQQQQQGQRKQQQQQSQAAGTEKPAGADASASAASAPASSPNAAAASSGDAAGSPSTQQSKKANGGNTQRNQRRERQPASETPAAASPTPAAASASPTPAAAPAASSPAASPAAASPNPATVAAAAQ